MDKLTLNNQVTIPLTGLGVYQINNLDECEHTVLNVLKMGYRLIDTAACYGNEKAVNSGVTGESGDNKKISWQGLYSYGVYGAYNRPSEKSNGYRL